MLPELNGVGLTLMSVAILLFVVWILIPALRDAWMVRKIPGPPGLPIIGHAFFGYGLTNEQMQKKLFGLNKPYGPNLLFRILNQTIVAISNPADVQIVMMNPKVRNRGLMLELIMNTFVKDCLLTLRGDQWSARRKLINTAFRLQIVVTYLETFAKKADDLANKLALVADGRSVDLLEDMNICTMSGFCETALGHKEEVDKDEVKDMLDKFNMVVELLAKRAGNVLVWPLWIYNLTKYGKAAQKLSKELFGFVDEKISIVWESQKHLGSTGKTVSTIGGKKLQTFIDLMVEKTIQEGASFPATHVRSDILLLAAGGTESCASTMSFFLMLMGIHPEYQEKIAEEQRSVFGDSLRPVQNEDIVKMPLLEMCIKETLRLFPPIPLSPRHLQYDLPISNGIVLPKGTVVVLNAFGAHRDPSFFEDPDRFWPERWLPENSVGRHPFAYIPYGGGARNCVALKYSQFQLKVTLSRLVRQFKFSCDFSREELDRLEFFGFIRPVLGFHVRMVPRKSVKSFGQRGSS